MLSCLNKQTWDAGLHTENYKKHNQHNEELSQEMLKMTKLFTSDIIANTGLTSKQIALKKVGQLNPKRRMGELSREMLENNIVQNLTGICNTRVFR